MIIAKDKYHLQDLIKKGIRLHGNECDLNHINISGLTDLNYLFSYSEFNGNISQWDVSNVKYMAYMFTNSSFNKDISEWNVSNVESMNCMFSYSQFDRDLSNWKPYSLDVFKNIFKTSKIEPPYWSQYYNQEERNRAIGIYLLNKELSTELIKNEVYQRKIKI